MKKGLNRLAVVLTALILGCVLSAAATAKSTDVIKIGYFNWGDDLFTTHVVSYILTHDMNKKVKLISAAPAAAYQAVAAGDIDFHTDMWLPDTHADYFHKVAQKTIDAGAIYTRAAEGWAVPDYIPKSELNSIEDLKKPDVKKKLDGKIIGIDPGAGLMRLSAKSMKEYGLSKDGYTLVQSSGPAMTSALDNAIKNKQWIVVTSWNPHWMWARYHLRYLKDPKNVMTGMQRADIVIRHGFYTDHPHVYEMLDRILIPINDVEAGMFAAQKNGGDYGKAAEAYVKAHPKLVHYWVTGKID